MEKLIKMEDVMEKGVFCPVTNEGTIIVDNVFCSCYASCDSFFGVDGHAIAHFGFLPVTLMSKTRPVKSSFEIADKHSYFKLLEKLQLPWMSSA